MKIVDSNGDKIHSLDDWDKPILPGYGSTERLKALRNHLDKHFEAELQNLNPSERAEYAKDRVRQMTPEEQRLYKDMYPEYYTENTEVSPVEEMAKKTRELAVGRQSDNPHAGITEHFQNIENILMGNVNGLDKGHMGISEYINRRNTLLNVPIGKTSLNNTELHDKSTSLKRFIIDHIRSTDMPPMATSVVFRMTDAVEPINIADLDNLVAKPQPFEDYTLGFDVLNKPNGNQYEFIRVFKYRGDLTMAVFNIDLFGAWQFKYRVPLRAFVTIDCIPRIDHDDIVLGTKENDLVQNSVSQLHFKQQYSADARQQYIRLAHFLRDFEEYDIEAVHQVMIMSTLKHRPREIKESYVEYVLDKSKTKKVKRIELEERERAKYVKEEPKTREYDRIGHKRTLQNGRVISVKGTTCNPGSPLGKIVKDYKFGK